MESRDMAVERARKRVEEIKGLYVHMLVYVLTNICLFALDMISSPGTTWFYWPAFGWGIGLAIHTATVLMEGRFGPEWEERKVRRLVEREREVAG